MPLYLCTHAEDRGQLQVPSHRSCAPCFSIGFLTGIWGSLIWVGWLSSTPPETLSVPSQHHHTSFLCGCQGLRSRPQACTTSLLLTELSPQPLYQVFELQQMTTNFPPFLSPGYKPFLNIIKPQLQKLSEITEEQVQPDTFQPITVGKTPEQSSPRAEESRGSSSRASISQSETGSNSVVSRKEEDTTQADEEEPFQDGAYDCCVS